MTNIIAIAAVTITTNWTTISNRPAIHGLNGKPAMLHQRGVVSSNNIVIKTNLYRVVDKQVFEAQQRPQR